MTRCEEGFGGCVCARWPEARCFRFEQCPHAVDVAEAIQIEFGDANSAVALLHENATRQKFKHGLADWRRTEAQVLHQLYLPKRLTGNVASGTNGLAEGINGHFSLSAKARPLRISHLRRSKFYSL